MTSVDNVRWFQTYSILGQKKFFPGLYTGSDRCGMDVEDSIRSIQKSGTEANIDRLSNNSLNRARNQESHNSVETRVQIRGYYPIETKPETPEFFESPQELSEVDRFLDNFLGSSQPGHLLDWQRARAETIKSAYKISEIYSISFKPKDPEVKQTWYFRKGMMERPLQSGFSKEEGRAIQEENFIPFWTHEKGASQFPATRISGFLKPYFSYQSKVYLPDDAFDQAETFFVENEEDITKLDMDPALKEVAYKWLKDTQALAIGLTTIRAGSVQRKTLQKV